MFLLNGLSRRSTVESWERKRAVTGNRSYVTDKLTVTQGTATSRRMFSTINIPVCILPADMC